MQRDNDTNTRRRLAFLTVAMLTSVALAMSGAIVPVTAQRSAAATAAERESVRQAVLDYVEGIYDVAPERIIRSVHPTLAKRGYQVPKDSTRYHEYPMTHAQLVNVAKTFNAKRWIKPDAPKQIEVFEVLDQMASAKLRAVWGIDYFHLAKYDGKWMIVNVMWQAPPEEHPLYKRPSDDASAATSSPRNDLAGLSDDFSSAQRLTEWKQVHDVEGWTNKLKTLDVNRTRAGALYLEPHTSVWYMDYTAPFMFKEVEGDFMVTTRLRVTGTGSDYPRSTYSLAGLMVRRPRADAPYALEEKWPKDREGYVFAVTGTTDEPGKPILETKSAVRSLPLVKHYPLEKTGWLELRIARLGRSYIVLYRPEGGAWTVHERYYRPDLGPMLQVGVMAYGDFDTIEKKYWYRPWEYNTTVIKDGKADMGAEFDWVRFERITPSASATAWLDEQNILWDDHRIDNARLISLLPDLGR